MAYPFDDYNDTIEYLLEENKYLMEFRFLPWGYVTLDSDRYALHRIKIIWSMNLN